MTIDICDVLKGSTYPGRGIIFGRSADNRHAVIAYFIMGRSVNSRNRVFVATEDGIRTQAYDAALMIDPIHNIYRPKKEKNHSYKRPDGHGARVSGGAGLCRRAALDVEPDAPNYTGSPA